MQILLRQAESRKLLAHATMDWSGRLVLGGQCLPLHLETYTKIENR